MLCNRRANNVCACMLCYILFYISAYSISNRRQGQWNENTIFIDFALPNGRMIFSHRQQFTGLHIIFTSLCRYAYVRRVNMMNRAIVQFVISRLKLKLKIHFSELWPTLDRTLCTQAYVCECVCYWWLAKRVFTDHGITIWFFFSFVRSFPQLAAGEEEMERCCSLV